MQAMDRQENGWTGSEYKQVVPYLKLSPFVLCRECLCIVAFDVDVTDDPLLPDAAPEDWPCVVPVPAAPPDPAPLLMLAPPPAPAPESSSEALL